ncbi:hypothetical protein D3C78_1636590 [compost metagenome]
MLGQFQGCGTAGVVAGLHQVEHALGIAQVLFGDALLLAQGQGLGVAVGDAAEQGQLHRRAVELAGRQRLQRTVPGRPFAAPEIQLISGTEVGVVVIDGAVVPIHIQLAVALAP